MLELSPDKENRIDVPVTQRHRHYDVATRLTAKALASVPDENVFVAELPSASNDRSAFNDDIEYEREPRQLLY
jgi:hypothetical protein